MLLSSVRDVQKGVTALEENLILADCVHLVITVLPEQDSLKSSRALTEHITFTMGNRMKTSANNVHWDIFVNLEQFGQFLAL